MSLEYAPDGLVGVLTPQANTTVEPELNILWPEGVAMLVARLVSDKSSMSARLVDYFASYSDSLKQFANAPIGVAVAACTGASYLAGRVRESELAEEITSRYGYPFITAGSAVVDALQTLQANKIGLVSPYPDDLNRTSIQYWQSYGFEVAEVTQAFVKSETFHPIYSLGGSAATAALRMLEGKPLDAVVMLGTGMPTLRPLAEAITWGGPPTMSCNLCLAWRAVQALNHQALSASSLVDWLDGDGWIERLRRIGKADI